MTNIVGGNTGSLSQVGSSQDGSSSNPLSTNSSSDFLSLISVAFEDQKNSSGEVSKFDNTDKSLSSNDLNLPLDLQKGEQIVAQVEKQVSSDDISAFLKGVNVSSDKDNIDVGISTLQLLGRLSKSDAGSLEELNETVDANTKDFITELSAYMEINGIRSDKALDLQTSDINSRIQSINTFVKENSEVLSFLGFVSNGKMHQMLEFLSIQIQLCPLKSYLFRI